MGEELRSGDEDASMTRNGNLMVMRTFAGSALSSKEAPADQVPILICQPIPSSMARSSSCTPGKLPCPISGASSSAEKILSFSAGSIRR